ncbi:MAG: glutamate racemase [Gammaproteobacteria bacterium RIFCSPHIGHO2_12_FULL_37_34]|nr:MAG: glutamate racemase [Gammaproteobacteria bacterium RIFCSPHIGHO2_12_FULL_37_34]
MIASQPIGIFDSGIGGLTIAHALVKELAKENIIYFGDTAHLPYGDKSTASIQAYSIKIAQLLLEQECKLILMACHSASSAAYELVKEYVANQAMVVNVIDPVVSLLKKKYQGKQIGLIGTRQTINSNIFKKKIEELNASITLFPHITNLLASAIEEFGNHAVIDQLLKIYLSHPNLQQIDAIVLACTHYPIIKERISYYYNHSTEVIDPSSIVAETVKRALEKNNLINIDGVGNKRFYVSDYTDSFAKNATLFFDDEIKLEHYPLWD